MNLRHRHGPAWADIPRARATGGDGVTATWRLRVRMDDRPGTLARVAIRLAGLECNILGVTVLPVDGGVLDEIVVRTAPDVTRDDVVDALEHEDCACLGIVDADVRDLVDPATAGLTVADRVVAAPDEIAEAVRDIVAADLVTVVPADEANPGRDETGHRAVFAAGGGRAIVVRRRWAPFLHQELARGDALLALLTTVRANVAGPVAVTCTDGAALVLRDGTSGDVDAVALLHEHCSQDTLHGRYGTPRGPGRLELRALLTLENGTSVVAVCGREIVAHAQLSGEPGAAAATFALLVEDGWQRNGVGTAMLRRLADLAAARGHSELVADPGTADCGAGSPGVDSRGTDSRSVDSRVGRTALRAGLTPLGPDGEGGLRLSISR